MGTRGDGHDGPRAPGSGRDLPVPDGVEERWGQEGPSPGPA